MMLDMEMLLRIYMFLTDYTSGARLHNLMPWNFEAGLGSSFLCLEAHATTSEITRQRQRFLNYQSTEVKTIPKLTRTPTSCENALV